MLHMSSSFYALRLQWLLIQRSLVKEIQGRGLVDSWKWRKLKPGKMMKHAVVLLQKLKRRSWILLKMAVVATETTKDRAFLKAANVRMIKLPLILLLSWWFSYIVDVWQSQFSKIAVRQSGSLATMISIICTPTKAFAMWRWNWWKHTWWLARKQGLWNSHRLFSANICFTSLWRCSRLQHPWCPAAEGEIGLEVPRLLVACVVSNNKQAARRQGVLATLYQNLNGGKKSICLPTGQNVIVLHKRQVDVHFLNWGESSWNIRSKWVAQRNLIFKAQFSRIHSYGPFRHTTSATILLNHQRSVTKGETQWSQELLIVFFKDFCRGIYAFAERKLLLRLALPAKYSTSSPQIDQSYERH